MGELHCLCLLRTLKVWPGRLLSFFAIPPFAF